ncbi:MAG: hypothetical protein WC907_06850 [Acholeplasmataceae bacterium]|jgi:hypothetical protein
MSREHKIVAATLPCRGDISNGEAKFRFVIVAWFRPNGEIHEYSTHMEILPGQPGFTEGLHDGNYNRRWEDAFREFSERVTRHNMAFRAGNVSHIPGLDYMDCGCDLHYDNNEWMENDSRQLCKIDALHMSDSELEDTLERLTGSTITPETEMQIDVLINEIQRRDDIEAVGPRNIIDADRKHYIQERAEKQRRKLSKEGKGKYIEGS